MPGDTTPDAFRCKAHPVYSESSKIGEGQILAPKLNTFLLVVQLWGGASRTMRRCCKESRKAGAVEE